MNRLKLAGPFILLVSVVVFLGAGWRIAAGNPLGFLDFKAYYYASRCLLAQGDPYRPADVDRVFTQSGGALPGDPPGVRAVVVNFINPPTNLLLVAPLAALPWRAAQWLWTALTCASCILACILVWSVAAPRAPVLAAVLIGLLLASSQTLFAGGNAVGLVVGLTSIAAWCFIRERLAWVGIVGLAIALLLKPHDAGPVWLFFLLAGGAARRNALRVLLLTACGAAIAFAWTARVSPHWPAEMRANIAAMSSHGAMNSPSPGASADRSPGMVVDLQAVLAIVHDNPSFYNLSTFALCGALLFLWARKGLRAAPIHGDAAWLALAAIVPLSMLAVYHKPYDTKLLLLAIPACVQLWSERSLRGQAAMLLTLATLFCSADIPLAVFTALTDSIHPDLHTFAGRLVGILILRPVSLLLIALAAFYLTLWLRAPLTPAARTPQSGPA